MKKKQADRAYPASQQRGSSLVLVMIMTLATLLVLASFLSVLSHQNKTGIRSSLAAEARNAAEGAAEYALAEINRRASSDPAFGAQDAPFPLAGYTLSESNLAFLAPAAGNSHIVRSQIEFKAGSLSEPSDNQMLINAADPVYAQDSEVSKSLSVRSINIFAKAAAMEPISKSLIYSYVSEHVQVRDQSWFNYAIFYNMDMEFHAGTVMDIYGPVHTNTTAYVAAGGGNTLNFYSTLTAVRKILRQTKYNGTNLTTSNHTGTVNCISAAGMDTTKLVSMSDKQDSDSSTSFKTLAQTRWKGFVQDKSFSVNAFNPPGLPAYVPEDFTTTTTELRNNAYSLIEPQLSSKTIDSDYGQKPLVTENLKFSALSGFVIQVFTPTNTPTQLPVLPSLPPATWPSSAQPKWRIVVYEATDGSRPLSAQNLPKRGSDGKPVVAFSIDPWNDWDETQSPGGPAQNKRIKRALKKALFESIVSVPYRDGGTNSTSWGNGFSNLTAFKPENVVTYVAPSIHYPIYDRREGYIYSGNTTSTTNKLKGAMHALRINLGKLNALLNDTTGLWLRPDGSPLYEVAKHYSGVVYVQFPLATRTSSRFPSSTPDGDMIRPAMAATTTSPGYALVLDNAQKVPTVPGITGFTIATNGPVYVNGNFNADGVSTTGSTTAPDDSNEATALIAGDAVTVLSAPGAAYPEMPTTKRAANTFTEVSAAIITGLVPTQPKKNDIWSGGVHNFIRFLEDWNTTYRYRGSLAALYESEVAKAPYHEGKQGYWYDPPSRNIGYHQYLAQGKLPPGTPIRRTVRRMNLQDITAATYNAGPGKPPKAN